MGAKVADSGIPFISQIEGEYSMNMDQAKLTEQDARYNATQRIRQANILMGQQIAAVGASGVEIEGTPQIAIESDRKNAEIEAMNIVYTGSMQAAQMRRSAALNKQGGYLSLAKDAATFAITSGAFKGASKAGMAAESTGTNGYAMSESSSTSGLANKGLA